MKSYIFIILLIYQFFSATAQTSFEFILEDPMDQCGGSMIEDPNNNIIISVTNNNQFAKLMKLNNEGTLIDSIDILNPANGKCELFHLLKVDNAKFMAFGKYNTDTAFNLWAVTFDYDLNIVMDAKIPVNGDITTTFQHAIINDNGNVVIISSYEQVPSYSDVMMHELSADGNVIKEKMFDGSGAASDIIQLSSLEYRIIVYGHVYRAFVDIYCLDTNFAIVNSCPVPWDLHFHNTIKFINDTNFLISGKKIFPEKDNERDLGLVKTDLNNNLMDYKHYGKTDTMDYPSVHNNLDFVSENDIYYSGISNLDLFNPYFSQMPSWFILNKIDSNLNLKWQKFYGGDACYVPLTILATQDGGCVMAGTRYDYITQPVQERDLYVLKVDEGGLITWTQEIPMDNQPTTVYPNPGTNLLNIKTNNRELLFELIDMNGQVVIKQMVNNDSDAIVTESLKPGMYFYRMTDIKNNIAETGKWVKQ